MQLKNCSTITNRLLFWLKRWRDADTVKDTRIRYVVHYQGKKVKSLKRSWAKARTDSELETDIVPHIMRHTSITWAMQAGVDVNLVSSFYGVTIETLQKVYWHHHPDYQEDMRSIF